MCISSAKLLVIFSPTLIVGILRHFYFYCWSEEMIFLLWRRCHNGKNIMVINWQNDIVVWTIIIFWFGKYKNVVCCYYVHFLSSHNESWEESWKVLEHFRKVWHHKNVIFFFVGFDLQLLQLILPKKINVESITFALKKRLYDEQLDFFHGKYFVLWL